MMLEYNLHRVRMMDGYMAMMPEPVPEAYSQDIRQVLFLGQAVLHRQLVETNQEEVVVE